MKRIDEDELLKSTEKVGALYPILLDADGNIIDGNQRAKIEGWRQITLDWIKNPHDRVLGGIIAHAKRRDITREERRKQLNDLAELSMKDEGIPRGRLVSHISDETGFTKDYVAKLLRPEFKSKEGMKTGGVRGGGRLRIPPEKTTVSKATTPKTEKPEFYKVNCPGCGVELATNLKTTKLWIPGED